MLQLDCSSLQANASMQDLVTNDVHVIRYTSFYAQSRHAQGHYLGLLL